MRYVILKKQKGYGCDYTIGCGMRYDFEDFEGGLEKAVKYFGHQAAYPDGEDEWFALEDSSDGLEEVWVIPCPGGTQVNLEPLIRAHEAKEREWARAQTQRRERKEYERLRKKFGHG